jgi:hypothetical protein
MISQIAELVSAMGTLAWPGIVVAILVLARAQLGGLIKEATQKFKSSSELKIGMIEIKGAVVTSYGEVIRGDGAGIKFIPATEADVELRRATYARQRKLMLVHTLRPAEPEKWISGYRVLDVSIFLHPHRNFGHLNDVCSVSYFLRDKWGGEKYGSKFKVTSANDQFALTVRAYGSFLCVAEIEFHDGETVQVDRYIDAEMAPVYNISLKDARG